MTAAFVLIAGVLFIMIIGSAILVYLQMAHILATLVPLAPLMVAVGTILLILTEFLLFFGDKEDRSAAFRDLAYLFPTLIVSGGLYFLAKYFLW